MIVRTREKNQYLLTIIKFNIIMKINTGLKCEQKVKQIILIRTIEKKLKFHSFFL